MLREEEEFDSLKQHFILKTLSFLTTLEEMELPDVKQAPTKARIALLQAESAGSFIELCNYIQSLRSIDYGEIVRRNRMAF